MQSLADIVKPEIDRVEDVAIREALLQSYEKSAPTLKSIQESLREILETVWPEDSLCLFFKNWRNPAVGAGSFCALTCRLLEAALGERLPSRQQQLFMSAARLAEVSYEDMGLMGKNHGELYEEMATNFCGHDNWRLDRYRLEEATQYLTACREYRERGGDLVEALMISLAEELYNHGEFTFVAPLFKKFHDASHAAGSGSRQENMRFVLEHIGGTESGHFSYMVEGLELYCEASGQPVDATRLARRNCEFLQGMDSMFRHLLEEMRGSAQAGKDVSRLQSDTPVSAL
ncbi:MAG: hypothetical protein HRU39_01180 [Salinicola sp.]|uniref:hypothetical protein n=1 Tax=Salinicola sp. TaxID=1978524 RepID=UPI001D4CFFC3|nr:hypothetical protein [Salinicola sp.]NRB54583.1 hypothetical protein [Salinicola sp.]